MDFLTTCTVSLVVSTISLEFLATASSWLSSSIKNCSELFYVKIKYYLE